MNRTPGNAVGPATRRVLCIDDDADYLTILTMSLRMPGVTTVTASSAEEGLEKLRADPYDLILTDIQMPGQSGFEFIRSARDEGFSAPILVLTAQGSIQGAVEALKLGARDYLTKPIDPERLRRTVEEILKDPVAEISERDGTAGGGSIGFQGMLGVSSKMAEVFDRIRRVAKTDATVLVVGESGTGKELVSRAVHNCSNRTDGPFVPVHTGAIPRELIASELFGHERGSFTGAVTAADGKFDAAMKGTLFLDEIGTMDLAVQVALLRVLETFRFTRVGGRKERVADVRVLAATNRDVAQMVQEGTFREDLYYRLNVFTIVIPPLRERPEDIPGVAEHYLRRFANRHNSPARVLSPSALERLLMHPWPGNIRELRNVMEQTAVFARGEEIHVDEVQIVDTHISSPSVRNAVAASMHSAAAHSAAASAAASAHAHALGHPSPTPSAPGYPPTVGAQDGLPAARPSGVGLPAAGSSDEGATGEASATAVVSPVGVPASQRPGQVPGYSSGYASGYTAGYTQGYAPSGPRDDVSMDPPARVAPAVAPPNPTAQLASAARMQLGSLAAALPDESLVLRFPIGTTVEAAEKSLILRTLEVIGGNKQKAARILGISRRCLYNKLASYGISTSPSRDDEHPDDPIDHPDPSDHPEPVDHADVHGEPTAT